MNSPQTRAILFPKYVDLKDVKLHGIFLGFNFISKEANIKIYLHENNDFRLCIRRYTFNMYVEIRISQFPLFYLWPR